MAKRRILHKLKLTEISGVDKPCQQGAEVRIMKRADHTKAEANYRAAIGTKRCGSCSMFRAPSSCTLVMGAIGKGDVCDYWEQDAAKAQEMLEERVAHLKDKIAAIDKAFDRHSTTRR